MKTAGIYFKAWQKGKALLKRPGKALQVIKEASRKSEQVKNDGKLREKVPEWKNRLNLLGRMVKAYIEGRYVKIPKSVVIRALAALLYFVWVVDAIPDFVLGLGFIDDATILAWFFSSVNEELEEFKEWEDGNDNNSGKGE